KSDQTRDDLLVTNCGMIRVGQSTGVDKYRQPSKFSTSCPQVENRGCLLVSQSYPHNSPLYYGYCFFF
ncbi:hypothetical protein I2491_11545, partial [Levilactobacillus brevis]|nr:hypothetical protein [Levilactobacillus brevis]